MASKRNQYEFAVTGTVFGIKSAIDTAFERIEAILEGLEKEQGCIVKYRVSVQVARRLNPRASPGAPGCPTEVGPTETEKPANLELAE